MSHTAIQRKLGLRRHSGMAQPPRPGGRSRRRRRLRRILLATSACLVVLAGAVAGGGYFYANHVLSSIRRIPVAALDAAHQPVMPTQTRQSQTVLVTGSFALPGTIGGGGVDGSSTAPEDQSGLITLVHFNASGRAGAVVSIPPNAVVAVPGHGQTELWNTLTIGGPSLLIRTVEGLTNVRIDHYSVVDFPGVSEIISAMGGVDVDVPYTVTSFGDTFPPGIDLLTGADVLPYVRQPGVSEIGRELLQQNLMRAVLDEIASRHLFSHLMTDYHVLDTVSAAFSVDSNFSNSQLEHDLLKVGNLRGHDGTFVSAQVIGESATMGGTSPVHLSGIDRQLWRAIRDDSVAAFAARYPYTVTPGAPG